MRIDDMPNVLDITECMELLDLQHYIFSHKIRRDIYESFVKRKKKPLNATQEFLQWFLINFKKKSSPISLTLDLV